MFRSGTTTAGVIVAELRMIRAASAGPELLVEGPFDSRFWRSHCDFGPERIVICHGKPVLLEAINLADTQGITKVIAIADDDLDRHLGVEPSSPNVVVTAHHDLEGMILASTALERVVDVMCEPAKLAAFIERERRTFREALVARCLPFARLRYISRKMSLNVPFKTVFRVQRYVSVTWDVDTVRLTADFLRHSGLSADNLKQEIALVPMPENPWSLLHGHDAYAILRIGLQELLLNNPLSATALENALNIAYTRAMLEGAALRQAIAVWEIANSCKVLCDPPQSLPLKV